VKCEVNYHIVSNALVASAQGYCEWCFDDLYDRFPTCGARVWSEEEEECMCEEGTWFDPTLKTCRHCSHNCVECLSKERDSSGMHCTGCKDGNVFLKNSDICVNTCPTGYTASPRFDSCVGTGGLVVEITAEREIKSAAMRHWVFEESTVD
jgi:hypothetical protein